MNVISFLYKLLFGYKRKKRKGNNPELFHSDNFLRPNHPNNRACPKCNIEAKTNREAAEIFGIRNTDGFSSIQSWCTNCRNEKKNNQVSREKTQSKMDLNE